MSDIEKRCGTCEHWKRDEPVKNENSLGKCRPWKVLPEWLVDSGLGWRKLWSPKKAEVKQLAEKIGDSCCPVPHVYGQPPYNAQMAEFIIDAEFSREPARLQAREAIERAAEKAVCTGKLGYILSEDSVRFTREMMAGIVAEVAAAFTLQPCGHLVTSIHSSDEGTNHCEQCALEAEIVSHLRGFIGLMTLVGFRKNEPEEIVKVNALLAKLEGKESKGETDAKSE